MGKLLWKEVKRGEYDDFGRKFQRRDDVKVRHHKGRKTEKKKAGKTQKGQDTKKVEMTCCAKSKKQ